jgi:hypothetical protein
MSQRNPTVRVLEAAALGHIKIIEKPNGSVEILGRNKADMDRIKTAFDKRRRKIKKNLNSGEGHGPSTLAVEVCASPSASRRGGPDVR